MIFPENFLDDFIVRVRITIGEITPAAAGGIVRIVYISVGKGCLQVFDDFPGRRLVNISAGINPEPLKPWHFLQDRQVIDFIQTEIQIHQVGQVAERGNIPDFVFEKFGIFQLL